MLLQRRFVAPCVSRQLEPEVEMVAVRLRRFSVKPLCDALCSLGFIRHFRSLQRLPNLTLLSF